MLGRVAVLVVAMTTSSMAADRAPFLSNSQLRGPIDWTGAYVGVQLGVARTTGKAERTAYAGPLLIYDVANGLFPASIEQGHTGLAGGVTAGYNQQIGSFVLGVEADGSLSGIKADNGLDKVDPNPTPPFTGVHTITGYSTDISAYATIRLRAGFALGRTLVYATGGVAAGHVTNRFTLQIPELSYVSPGWSSKGVRFGYAVGAGVEQKLTPRLSAKLEFLSLNLEDTTINAADPVTFPGETISYKFTNSALLWRAGLNMKF